MAKRYISVNTVGAVDGSIVVFIKIVVTEINLLLIVIPIQDGLRLHQLYNFIGTASLS